MSMKRFEFKEGNSSKFWEISREGSEITVRWGRIGTAGQGKTTCFTSADEATRKESSLIAEKLGKGYAPVSTDLAAQTTSQDPKGNRNLESTKAPNQKQEGPRIFPSVDIGGLEWLAGLIQGQDPELAVHDLEKKEKVVTEEVNKKVIPGFDGQTKFQNGLFTIVFNGESKTVSTAVCSSIIDQASQLAPRCVHVICETASPGRSWSEAMIGKQLSSIHSFILDDPSQTVTRQCENSIGEIDVLVKALPNLRNLFASGDLSLASVNHSNLRTLCVLGSPLSLEFLRNLGKCKFDNLDCLAISPISDGTPEHQRELVSAIFSLSAPRLSKIHIQGVLDLPSMLSILAENPLPVQIKTISITDAGEISAEEVVSILDARIKHFESLQTLALPLDSLNPDCPELPCLTDSDGGGDIFLPTTYEQW